MAYSRRFYFFEKEVLKDPFTKQPFTELQDVNVSCAASGRGYLWFGDATGSMHCLDCALKKRSFKAHEQSVRHCLQLKQHDILITVGRDDVPEDRVKVWNWSKWDGEGAPFCSRIILRATLQNYPESPVTCLDVMENLNYMAIGHENGLVQLFKGDVTRDRHSKPRVLHSGPRPITSVGLHVLSVSLNLVVYITTEVSISSILIAQKNKEEKYSLDQFGCHPKCGAMLETAKDSHFVMASRDAIYFYLYDGRGPCLAMDGDKAEIHFFKNYLIVSNRADKSGIGSSAELGSSTASATAVPITSTYRVTVFDYHNKFIAGEYAMSDVQKIFSEWGGLFVYCGGGTNKIFSLVEKDTQSKLDILFSKKCFNLAIELAKSQHYDEDGLSDIFRRYADHHYQQKDYDAAMQEYIKTIGKLEASYVIQKFLDVSRIKNLAAYLQALHRAQLATADHTTLLLNCYTKLKQEEDLTNFINSDHVDFDVETAIRVLRQSKYNTQARDLALRKGRQDWYLRILLEDFQDYQTAVQYIARLPPSEALNPVCTHGKILMAERPTEMAGVLETLCANTEVLHLDVSHFMRIFVNNRQGLRQFIKRYIKMKPRTMVPGAVETLLELYLFDRESTTSDAKLKVLEKEIMDLLRDQRQLYNWTKALMLCHQRQFDQGYLYLYEVNGDYEYIMNYYMKNGDFNGVMGTCKRFGEKTPNLWMEALTYFADKPDCEANIREIITYIDDTNLASPVVVVQRLADSGARCTLGVIKDYLLSRLRSGAKQIEEDNTIIEQYREETENNREFIRRLKTQVKIFQMQKCSVCNQALDLPSVNFLCDHSYHMQCFQSYTESENECPLCTPKNRRILSEVERWQSERGELVRNRGATEGTLGDTLRQLQEALRGQRVPSKQTEKSAAALQTSLPASFADGDSFSTVVSEVLAKGTMAPTDDKETSKPAGVTKSASTLASVGRQASGSSAGSTLSLGSLIEGTNTIASGLFSQFKGVAALHLIKSQSQTSLAEPVVTTASVPAPAAAAITSSMGSAVRHARSKSPSPPLRSFPSLPASSSLQRPVATKPLPFQQAQQSNSPPSLGQAKVPGQQSSGEASNPFQEFMDAPTTAYPQKLNPFE